jgi:hypothetical protein
MLVFDEKAIPPDMNFFVYSAVLAIFDFVVHGISSLLFACHL